MNIVKNALYLSNSKYKERSRSIKMQVTPPPHSEGN